MKQKRIRRPVAKAELPRRRKVIANVALGGFMPKSRAQLALREKRAAAKAVSNADGS